MIHFDDLTPEELAVRALLTGHRWGKKDTAFARWCQQIRDDWEATPAGQRAAAGCEAKRGKIRRRVFEHKPEV
jgi:hypothetical protein